MVYGVVCNIIVVHIMNNNDYTIKEQEVSFIRLCKPWISDTIIVSLNGIVTFDHYNSFKNNFTTTLRHARKNYFQRKFTECSNNSRDTWKTLDSLI